MKQLLKRLISTLLVLSLAFASMPAVAFATPLPSAPLVQQQAAAAVIPDPTEADQQIYTIHLTDKPQIVLSSWGIDCLTDPEEAGLLLRQAMKERKTNLTIYYEASASISFEDMIAPIRDVAMAHTANPTEGDYLKWQRGEIGVTANYYSDNITNEYKLDFTIEYYTTAQQEAQVDAAVAALLQSLNLNGKTDYEKLCAVYDWMCANITYDNANLNNSSYKLKHTAYAALINRTAVCQGYAVLLYRLMLELGIDCRVVTGIGNGGAHGWNIIKLDGRYYNVDATWDATCQQAGLPYNFFLRSDATFEDHTRDDEFATAAFNTAYPMGTTDYTPPVQSNTIASGTCGDNLTWVLTDDGVLTISGTGKMENFSEGGSPWHLKRTKITSVVIEEGITSIGNYAFFACLKLQTIDIPEGITEIGNYAFQDCTKLATITIPEGVTYIGYNAFRGCTSLQSIVIPEGVTSIKSFTFELCTSLQSIVIPECVTSIGSYAFRGCTSLQGVEIPEGVTSIGGSAFYNCTSLQSIAIPESVITINDWTFYGCTSLQSVVIPEGVTSIGGSAFEGCAGLQSVVIPEGITSIGKSAFYGCTSLQNILIPEGVASVDAWTFYGCTSLQSIVIPEGVTSIGRYAFADCSSLQSIVIPEGVTSIGECMFYGCTSLQSIVIPEGVTYISQYAFEGCAGLQSVVIPEGVTSIGNYAFNGCTSLQSIVIPKSVTTIGNGAFYNCPIWHVLFSGSKADWNEITINSLNYSLDSAIRHYNCTGNEVINAGKKECSICISGVPGDLNGDSAVTDADAIYLLYATFDPDSYPLNQSADYNSDGELTDADAIYLLYATFDPEGYPLA